MITEKKCTKCGEVKSISEFSKKKKGKYGFNSHCKQCIAEYAKQKKRTYDGLINVIYGHQKRNSRHRNHTLPSYTNKEFKQWCKKQIVFYMLFDQWKVNDYKKEFTPSGDRINDYESYTLNNLQLMTWKENNKKIHHDMRNGINNKQSKEVWQYDLEGNFIAEYYSQHQAARETGISVQDISRNCNKDSKFTHGYIFTNKNETPNLDFKIHPNAREVVQLDKNTNMVINEFESILKASYYTGIASSSIGDVCKRKLYKKTAGGFKWQYKEEYYTENQKVKKETGGIV